MIFRNITYLIALMLTFSLNAEKFGYKIYKNQPILLASHFVSYYETKNSKYNIEIGCGPSVLKFIDLDKVIANKMKFELANNKIKFIFNLEQKTDNVSLIIILNSSNHLYIDDIAPCGAKSGNNLRYELFFPEAREN